MIDPTPNACYVLRISAHEYCLIEVPCNVSTRYSYPVVYFFV